LLSSLAKADITPDKYLAAIEYTESFSYYQNSIARIAQLYNGEVEHYITTKSSKELVKKLLPPNLQEQVSDTFSILQLDSSTFFNPELLKRLQSTLLTQKPKTTRELNEILVGLLRPGLIPLIKSQYVSDVMVVPNEDKSIGNAQKKLVIKLNAEAIKNITPTNETFTETIYYGDLLYIIEPVFVTQPKQLMAQKLTLGDQFNYLTKDSLIFDKSNMFFSIPREPEDGEYLLIRKFDYR
jgi:hypothetical protein